MFTDGRRLDNLLSTTEYDAVKSIIGRSGMPVDLAAVFKPWIVSMILSVSECERDKVQKGARVLDMEIAEIGKARGLEVVGLETIPAQIEALAAVPEQQQLDMLRASLKFADRTDDMMETLVQLYLNRKITAAMPFQIALAREAGVTDQAFVGFQEKLLVERNVKMLDVAAPLLDQGGVFVAVGALHLPGDKGLVALLRDGGYTVSRPSSSATRLAGRPHPQVGSLQVRTSHVEGALVDGEGSFLHGFGQRRMRVAGARQILGRAAELHQHRRLGDHLRRVGAEDVHAEHAVGRGIGEDLHEAVGDVVGLGAAVGGERELADLVGDAGGLQFLFRLADARQLRRRVDDIGNDAVVHVPGLPGEDLGDRDALVLGLVRQHRPVDHVADGVDARHVRSDSARRRRRVRGCRASRRLPPGPSPSVNGTRPMATSTTSVSSVSASPPFDGSIVTLCAPPFLSTPVTL